MLRKLYKGFKKRPEELVLDFDVTDDPVHGNQEGRFTRVNSITEGFHTKMEMISRRASVSEILKTIA